MDIGFNFIIGVLAIVYGLYSFIQRKVAPEKIEKLQTMIERNGEKMAHSMLIPSTCSVTRYYPLLPACCCYTPISGVKAGHPLMLSILRVNLLQS
jgi:hypothetical protein